MPRDPIAPLLVANEKEKERSWEDLSNPKEFADWIQRLFAVDLASIKKELNAYVGPNEPQGGDRGKLHVKTSRPPAIGIFVNGSYDYIYQYPANIPLQFPSGSDLPVGVSELTNAELSAYNLTSGDDYVWAWLKV